MCLPTADICFDGGGNMDGKGSQPFKKEGAEKIVCCPRDLHAYFVQNESNKELVKI